jgi:hypothetical protein
MRDRGLSRASVVAIGVLGVLTLLFALLALEILDGGADQSSPRGALELIDGVPIGVAHTPAGALAAADNYLAVSSQSIEQEPPVFAALVAQGYASAVRARTLAEAEKVRAADPQNMANYAEGGRGIAVVAARRLDGYSAQTATITSWLAGFVWGPHMSPRQSWNLVDTTLRWQSGRWLVVSSATDSTPAPVPSVVYLEGSNDRTPAFARLAGMTAPYYAGGG